MRTHFLVLCVAIALLCPTAHAEEKTSGEPLFHPPQTEAEKALDEIVKTSIAKPDMFPIILQKPDFELSKTTEFDLFFTDTFLIAWRQYEKDLVDEYCEGKYQSGKKCGIYFNPLYDAEHWAPPYSYRTVMGDDHHEALITLAPANDRTDNGTYYMQREKGRWKLGGLYAGMEGIPDTIPDKALMKKFRQPKFESERRLEDILQIARTNRDIIPFIFDLSWRDPSKGGQYSRLFTSALLRAWKKQAKAVVQHDCSEGYYEGGKGDCEFFTNPITCGTEEIDIFIVRTTEESSKSSILTYSYPGGHPGVRYVFRMRKDDGRWKLDGVDCNDFRELKFNMP